MSKHDVAANPAMQEVNAKLQAELEELRTKFKQKEEDRLKIQTEYENTNSLYETLKLQYETSTEEVNQLRIDKHDHIRKIRRYREQNSEMNVSMTSVLVHARYMQYKYNYHIVAIT